MEKKRILIVDDDENIAELISLYLLKECFDTEIVGDGEQALVKFKDYKPQLILLDIMLPGIDGYDVCREIRKSSNVPIIMLSAKGEVFDKVLGLKIGADDYMIKPFDSNELVARVQAVLRRVSQNEAADVTASEEEKDCVKYDGLTVDLTGYSVIYNGKAIDMPAGPSEVMVIADRSADPRFVAADLLSQAEHGPDSQVILLTTASCLVDRVQKEIESLKSV